MQEQRVQTKTTPPLKTVPVGQKCLILEHCDFFKSFITENPFGLKTRYCNGNYEACSRFVVCSQRGIHNTPDDLSPVDVEYARVLLS